MGDNEYDIGREGRRRGVIAFGFPLWFVRAESLVPYMKIQR